MKKFAENESGLLSQNLDDAIYQKVQKDLQFLHSLPSQKLEFYHCNPKFFFPAVSQGALAIEISKENSILPQLKKILEPKKLETKLRNDEIYFSRKLMEKLNTGCHSPFGVYIDSKKISAHHFFQLQYYQIYYFYIPEKNYSLHKSTKTIYKEIRYIPKLNEQYLNNIIQDLKNINNRYVVFCGLDCSNFSKYFSGSSPFSIYHIPLIKIKKRKSFHKNIKDFYNCIFICSQNSVNYMHSIPKAKLYITVGEKTTNALKEKIKGNDVRIETPNAFNSSKMVEYFLEKFSPNDKKNYQILWIGAKNGNKTGIASLRKSGFSVQPIAPYKTVQNTIDKKKLKNFLKKRSPKNRSPLEKNTNKSNRYAQKPYWIFTSPSSVKSYYRQNLFSNNHFHCCIGDFTAKSFLKRGHVPFIISRGSSLKSLAFHVQKKIEQKNYYSEKNIEDNLFYKYDWN